MASQSAQRAVERIKGQSGHQNKRIRAKVLREWAEIIDDEMGFGRLVANQEQEERTK